MIFALSLFGHADHMMVRAHVPVNAAALDCRCLWPANLRRKGRMALGIVAICVVVGDDIQPVAIGFFRPVRQFAAVLKPQWIPI